MGIFVAALWLMSSGVAMSDDTGLVLPPAADESVYVVQERAYLKRGYLEVTPIFYTSLNGKFVGYTGAAVAVAYHLRENFALELTSSIPGLFFATFSDLSWELYDYAQLGPPAVDLKQMSYFGALSLQFSALYGKLSLYNLLLDYDFYVSGGVGVVRLRETCTPGSSGCSATVGLGLGLQTPVNGRDAGQFTANLAVGARVFFSQHFGLRLEVRDLTWADRRDLLGQTTTDIRNNLLFFLGVSAML